MSLKLESINKSFDKKVVLHSVTFSVDSGEIIGIIGPNGSGKTTLLNLIMGLLRADSGTILSKPLMSAAVSRRGFFDNMTVTDNLKIFAETKGLNYSEIGRVLDMFCIKFGDIKFSNLSAGMKQRAALAQAFMGNHKLILLDEPTNHLDIDSILNLRYAIESYKKEGVAFILTSHILTELEKLCDRVVFLIDGEIRDEIRSKDERFNALELEYLKLSKQK